MKDNKCISIFQAAVVGSDNYSFAFIRNKIKERDNIGNEWASINYIFYMI